MTTKINPSRIVGDHLATLRNGASSSKKYFKADLFFFYGIPLIIAILLIYFSAALDKDSVSILLSAFAILTGLLFNLLALLLTVAKNRKTDSDTRTEVKDVASRLDAISDKQILKDTFANVSYSILVGITLTAVCIGGLSKCWWINKPVSLIVFFGGLHFALTLFMILKRIHNLLDECTKD